MILFLSIYLIIGVLIAFVAYKLFFLVPLNRKFLILGGIVFGWPLAVITILIVALIVVYFVLKRR